MPVVVPLVEEASLQTGERLRYVTLDVGGRPSTVLDMNDMVTLAIVRGSFKPMAAAKQQIMSVADRRYGGSRQVAETTDNGTVSWTSLVAGITADDCIAKLEALLSQAEADPRGLLVEWRPDGASQSAYYEVRGTANWTTNYDWVQFSGAQSLVVDLSIPVAPLARGLPMDILDLFDVDTRGDYTYDAGAEANEEVTSSQLFCAENPDTEQVAIHTARGYQYGDQQQTVHGAPGLTITGYKLGVALKRTGATTRIEVYVDDNGTSSRLRIDKVVAGVRTNLKSTNLAARIKFGDAPSVRGRIEGNVITAEHFSGAPTPMGTRTTTNTYTLSAGAEQEAFGPTVQGYSGRVWIPKSVGATIVEFAAEPWVYRNVTLPAGIALAGAIPGTAPARADVTVTHVGGAAAPIFGLIGWSRKPASASPKAPFGIIEAEAMALSGWTSAESAAAHGGFYVRDTASKSSTSYFAGIPVNPALMVADAFTAEIAIEVWARVFLAATIVSPNIVLSLEPTESTLFGARRYSDEWGSAGKLLTVPTAGGWRFVRLGTLRMPIDTLRAAGWKLRLDASVGAGSSGEWGLDYLLALPVNQRASSPTGKPNSSSYPIFIASLVETSKTIRSNLSAITARPPENGAPDHGLGGQLIELPPGEDEVFVKLSSLAPDDPTSNATTEQLSHAATVHVAVTPGWNLVRSEP